MNKNIYIVLTQTGTILSRIVKKLTGAEYNHASISLDDKFEKMFSFGRINAYNPFIGGLVKESPTVGTFKRFKDTDALILSVEVTDEQYTKTSNFLSAYYSHRKSLHYNYKGLFFAAFGKAYRKRHRFYCSEFVKKVLVNANVIDKGQLPDIIHPIDFLKLFCNDVIFKGKLATYMLAKNFKRNLLNV